MIRTVQSEKNWKTFNQTSPKLFIELFQNAPKV